MQTQAGSFQEDVRRGRADFPDPVPATVKPRPTRLGPTKSEAPLLAALARECALAGIGRCVLLLRLSGLPPALRRPHHVRLARAALEPLAQADRARLFLLKGDDLALVWRGDSEALLDAATTTLDRLFEDAAAPPWLLFRLPHHADALIATLRPPLAPPPPDPMRRPPGKLDIRALALLEGGLARVDVAQFMRRSRVCALDADGNFGLRWEQRFLSVAELADTIAPDRAMQADPWLFRRLTRTLDQWMLALLSAPRELDDAGAFSITLNVASILSPGFLRFDAALPTLLRGHVILELLPPDVLGDLPAFVFARDFVRERGYRLLLRDLDAASLPMFTPSRMGVDWVQLRWSEGFAAQDDFGPPEPPRCVLTHADTPPAVRWGQSKGIGLFQGRMADPP